MGSPVQKGQPLKAETARTPRKNVISSHKRCATERPEGGVVMVMVVKVD